MVSGSEIGREINILIFLNCYFNARRERWVCDSESFRYCRHVNIFIAMIREFMCPTERAVDNNNNAHNYWRPTHRCFCLPLVAVFLVEESASNSETLCSSTLSTSPPLHLSRLLTCSLNWRIPFCLVGIVECTWRHRHRQNVMEITIFVLFCCYCLGPSLSAFQHFLYVNCECERTRSPWISSRDAFWRNKQNVNKISESRIILIIVIILKLHTCGVVVSITWV